nr:Rrf2 family transcriptional regulator [uncultured Blautia sp.]
MKISTKGRYAIRLMLDLASNDTGSPIRLKDVAKRQAISEKYLEQIISILNKAGFVRSVRGPQGGYSLSRAPEEYTVGMILRLTEGSLCPVDCAAEENGSCDREDTCVTRMLWKKLDDAISSVVDHVSLEDLLSWQNARADDYVI